jgi:hypothetical protein
MGRATNRSYRNGCLLHVPGHAAQRARATAQARSVGSCRAGHGPWLFWSCHVWAGPNFTCRMVTHLTLPVRTGLSGKLEKEETAPGRPCPQVTGNGTGQRLLSQRLAHQPYSRTVSSNWPHRVNLTGPPLAGKQRSFRPINLVTMGLFSFCQDISFLPSLQQVRPSLYGRNFFLLIMRFFKINYFCEIPILFNSCVSKQALCFVSIVGFFCTPSN